MTDNASSPATPSDAAKPATVSAERLAEILARMSELAKLPGRAKQHTLRYGGIHAEEVVFCEIVNQFPSDIDYLLRAHDALVATNTNLVERSVGAMAIAEGEEGWGKVPIDCPMLAAVKSLRESHDALAAEVERLKADRCGLTFAALRAANKARLPLFKNRRGEPAHSEPDGSDWCLAQWSNAVCGELGEAANIIKKIERGDMTLDEGRPHLAKELADVATYLDILAFRAGVNLGMATAEKFNEVSVRVGCDVRLPSAPAGTEVEGE